MIEIQAADRCHNCPEFQAETKKAILYCDGEPAEVTIYVVCAYAAKCEAIKKYLEGQK